MELRRIKEILELIVKVPILFGFIYEFVPYFVPSGLFSSRKVAFLIAVGYLFIKGYSLRSFMKDKVYKKLLVILSLCVVYCFILLNSVDGHGASGISWYIFFVMYAILGPVLMAAFFDWQIEKLLKALAIVTVIQAIWCILTFYIDDIKILNSVLFPVDEDENISYLSVRLRSIGGAGAALSVCIALSSYSFMYFIYKEKYVALNVISLLASTYATILAGTTGMLILTVSIPATICIVMRKKRKGIFYAVIILMTFIFLYNNNDIFWNQSEYDRLTTKYTSFFEDRSQNQTLVTLQNQDFSGINTRTIIGTGITRGRVQSGEMCHHDGGYIRNYFCLGLIMNCIMYFYIFLTMYKLSLRIRRTHIKYMLIIYTLTCMVIEYKEPFMFYYIPFFIFMTLYLTEFKNQTLNYK